MIAKAKIVVPALIATMLLAGTANAACRVEYKAKRDNPLRLDFGVAMLAGAECDSRGSAKAALENRLQAQGWTLLAIVSIRNDVGKQEGDGSGGGKSKSSK